MSYLFTSQRDLPEFRHLEAEPLSGALDATISGANLADDLARDIIDEIYAALLEFKVIFFRDQEMTDEQHLRLARKFGMPQGPGSIPQVEGYPMIRLQRMDEYQTIGGDVNYHTDDIFRDYPSRMSILRGLTMPTGGGNTIWRDNSVAIWDNRCTQHRGINDFSPAFRLMHRIPIIDDRRPSLNPDEEPRLDYDRNADFIRVEDLFVNKPELTYHVDGEEPAQGNVAAAESGNGAAQPEDEHAVEVDPKFLNKLNENRHGMVFTPGAAARLKKIPRMFRGAAISAVISEAQKRGSSEANIAILDAVQAKRRGG